MDRSSAIDTFVRVAESRQRRRGGTADADLALGGPGAHPAARSFRRRSALPPQHAQRAALGARHSFLRDCAELVGRTNEVAEQMREVTPSPTGRLRGHAPPGFVLGHLAKALQEFQARRADEERLGHVDAKISPWFPRGKEQ